MQYTLAVLKEQQSKKSTAIKGSRKQVLLVLINKLAGIRHARQLKHREIIAKLETLNINVMSELTPKSLTTALDAFKIIDCVALSDNDEVFATKSSFRNRERNRIFLYIGGTQSLAQVEIFDSLPEFFSLQNVEDAIAFVQNQANLKKAAQESTRSPSSVVTKEVSKTKKILRNRAKKSRILDNGWFLLNKNHELYMSPKNDPERYFLSENFRPFSLEQNFENFLIL